MKNLVCVVLFFLLADCYDDQDCMDHGCDSELTPYCKLHQSSHQESVGKRQSNSGSCHCKEAIHCHDDYDCDQLMCSGNFSPTCNSVHGHHRCICVYQPVKHPASTLNPVTHQSVQLTHCNQHSDCTSHICSKDKPIPYCKHDYLVIIEIWRHCDCAECVEDRDCNCTAGTTPFCDHYHSRGVGTCQCNLTISLSTENLSAATTTATVQSTTLTQLSTSACHTHTDCSGRICPSDKHPYCKIDRHSSTCHCTVCTEHIHCFCPLGMIGQCHFDYLHNSNSCVCGIAPVVTTITSVLPSTVTPLSTTACHAHTDCSGHICPSYKYPYCKFDRYSSTCHCTVCIEHKHCFCPQGLIGQCHFDYIHNSHSCVCGLPPDTTMAVSTLSTSKSVQTTTLQSTSVSSKSTTNSTQIPTTTKPATLSSTSTSKSTTRMVSVPSSTSATLPTSTSVPSAKQGIRCPTCDESLNCVWNQTCYPEESCMIRSRYGTKFTTHCTRKEDCSFIKNLMQNGEVFCCNDRVCLQTYLGV